VTSNARVVDGIGTPSYGSGVTRLQLTAVFEKHGRWYIGYVPEVPGVNAQERTLAEARRSLSLALRELAEIDPAAVRGRNRRVERIEARLSA
jgi:hypothetical protein